MEFVYKLCFFETKRHLYPHTTTYDLEPDKSWYSEQGETMNVYPHIYPKGYMRIELVMADKNSDIYQMAKNNNDLRKKTMHKDESDSVCYFDTTHLYPSVFQ